MGGTTLTAPSTDTNQPDITIVKLNEGFVLWYGGGYSVALTTADDLAKRVHEVALKLEGNISEAQPVTPSRTSAPVDVGVSPDLRERTAVAAVSSQGMSLSQEWENVEKLMAFFAAGFDTNGKVFTRKEWDAALPVFAPHVDPQEAEARLGEFLAELHDD